MFRLNPLKGGPNDNSQKPLSSDDGEDRGTVGCKSDEVNEAPKTAKKAETTSTRLASVPEQKDFSQDSESKIATKEEDHESGTTMNTSINGDQSTPVIEESVEEVDPSKDENDDPSDDQSQQGKQDEKKNENFTSPALRWYNPIRRFCGRIVNDDMFQVFIVMLIIANAAMMGIGTYDFVEDNPKLNKAFEFADLTFLIIFTIESTLQIGYHGYQLFQDGWLTFDLLVVFFSWTLNEMQVFRAMRVFRAFRLVARLAVLKDLVNAIVAVLPRIGSIMLLFGLVLYIYAVLCTILYGEERYGEDNEDYFGRIDYSLFTLFQFVTLENWGEISREIKDVHASFTYIVLSFLTVSSFILYSLVVAVVCDAVAVVEHPDIALRNFEEQMKREKKKTKKRVIKLTRHLDDLSQQQMEVLTSVQTTLMRFNNFREDAKDSQVQAAEMQAAAATLEMYE